MPSLRSLCLAKGEGPELAGWVRSPTAASENSSSLNLGLADWPLSGNRYFRFGSLRDRPLFDLIAEKRSVKFRFLEAASRHRVLPTQYSQSVQYIVSPSNIPFSKVCAFLRWRSERNVIFGFMVESRVRRVIHGAARCPF